MKQFLTITVAILVSTLSFAQIQKGDLLLGGSLGATITKTDPNLTITNPVTNATVYSSSGQERNNIKTNISPSISIFASSKWAVGLSPGYTWSKQMREYTLNGQLGTLSSKNNGFTIGGFAKYYLAVGEKIYLSLTTTVEYRSNVEKKQAIASRRDTANTRWEHSIVDDDYLNKSYDAYLGLKPSFLVLPAKRWLIEFSLGSIVYGSAGSYLVHDKFSSGSIEEPEEDVSIYGSNYLTGGAGLSGMSPSIGVYYFLKKK